MIALNTVERWQDDLFTVLGVVNDPIPVGPRQPIHLPKAANQHWIWLAAGAYQQVQSIDHWFCVASLEFSLGGASRGKFFFTDASANLLAAERAAAQRTLLRVRPDASGSQMTAMRYQSDANAAWSRDNLDIPCYAFNVKADQVIFTMDQSYYGSANAIGFLTGLRVLSMS
jgi:hypothetical protein